jgi:hypothetical protein
MRLPKEVEEKIKDREKRELDRYAAQRKQERLQDERRQRLLDEKLARRDEVLANARWLDQWRLDFINMPEVERLWGALGPVGRLPLFVGKFWLGEPCPPNDRTTCAILTLDGRMHNFHYEERHKGQLSSKSQPLATAQNLFDALHPDFLKQACEHLQSPDAWKFILQELDRHI